MKKQQEHSRRSDRSWGLSVLLLLPLMCAVIFCASQLGMGDFSSGSIERRSTPVETADYTAWNDIVFAPVDDALLTQSALEDSGEAIIFSGIATAIPTIERLIPVGIPANINNPTPLAPTPDDLVSSDDNTTVAQVSTDSVEATSTDDTLPVDTDVPTETITPEPSETNTLEPPETNTPEPSETATPEPSETNTALPTDTLTPVPLDTVIPPPSINFGASPSSGNAPLTVNFTNLSSGNVTSYSWNFGDGSTSSAASPSHTYTAPGSYYVRFDISGPGGSVAAGTTITVISATTDTPVPPPDSDEDGFADNMDVCPYLGDIGYGLDALGCPIPIPDTDRDGYTDEVDSCPNRGNRGYGVDNTGCPNPIPDTDGDGYLDNVDACPGFDDNIDTDGDSIPDGCDTQDNGDSDGDSVENWQDVCPGFNDLADADNDGTPDGCDTQDNGDSDGDTVQNWQDVCPGFNDLADADNDGTPDGCDTQDNGDSDGDTVQNWQDVCPGFDDLADADNDGTPDGCDTQDNGDDDGDGVQNWEDVCPAQGDQGNGVDATGCPNPASFAVTSLILVDAANNVDIRALGAVDSITLSGNDRTIRATVSAGTNSVVFSIDDIPPILVQTENNSPYAIAGDTGGGTSFNPWSYGAGTYTLIVTPYSAGNGNGTAGTAITITLTIN